MLATGILVDPQNPLKAKDRTAMLVGVGGQAIDMSATNTGLGRK